MEQTIENPATSLAEMIVEVPVIQTPERTQQVVNTSVQHVVNTVEVEKPKFVKETVQEKINQVTKHIKIPQVFSSLTRLMTCLLACNDMYSWPQTVQKTVEVPPLKFTDKVSDIPVVAQRQIPIVVQTIQKTTDIPQLQCIHKVIDVPVVSVAQAPHVQIVEKTVESSQMQIVEKTAEIPLLQIVKKTVETPEVQTVRCTQTSESLGNAPVCRSTQAEIVEAVEIGAIPPTKSARLMFVTTPVLETPPVVAEYVQLAPAVVPQGTTQEVLVPVAVPKKLDSPQVQLIDKVVSIPVMAQRHGPSAPRVQKIVEMSKVQFSDGEVDMPVVTQRQVPMIPNVQKTVEVSQIQYIDKDCGCTCCGAV